MVKAEEKIPYHLESERTVLGAILKDDKRFPDVATLLVQEDFFTEAHRRLYICMNELQAADENIDYVSMADALTKKGHLESVGGLSYLVSLTDGLPDIPHIETYANIIREKSRLRKLIYLSHHMESESLLGQSGSKDISERSIEVLMQVADTPDSGPVTLAQVIEEYPGGPNAFLQPHKHEIGVPTGFYKYDNMTGGFKRGELTIIAARPSVGKTALAMNMAYNMASNDNPCLIFSLEMKKEQLTHRILCSTAKVDSSKFRTGRMNNEELYRIQRVASEISKLPIIIDDNGTASLMDIYSKSRKVKAKHGLKVLIIDYLQLMKIMGRSENRNNDIGQISRGLKLMAKSLDVPIVVLSQLSRGVEKRQGDHRPQLADLRDSGNLEQDADVVAFIFREAMYKKDLEDGAKSKAELILSKQRNGAVGTIDLKFHESFTRFDSLASDYDRSIDAQAETA